MTSFVRSDSAPNILIRGAGIIGMAIAWRFLQRGVTPIILDVGPVEAKASWAAAGMLSAQFEALIEPGFSGQLHSFAARSVRMWPEFASELESDSGIPVHHDHGPTLGLIPKASLDNIEDDQRLAGIDCAPDLKLLDELVPGLVAGSLQPLMFLNDGQVDNRAVVTALHKVCRQCFSDDPDGFSRADVVIDCLGWKSENVRPVKGQMLSLEPRSGHPKIPVRWGAAYIVPKPDRLIIGATVEPDETSLTTDPEKIQAMLDAACFIVPGLRNDLEIRETWAGLRPMARQQRPLIGWKTPGKHYVATGHYRNGILLSPATADLVVSEVLGFAGTNRDYLADLRPDRA